MPVAMAFVPVASVARRVCLPSLPGFAGLGAGGFYGASVTVTGLRRVASTVDATFAECYHVLTLPDAGRRNGVRGSGMPSIVEILRRDPEPLPEWLATPSPPRFGREAFFASRTVYYPGSGDDGQPVKLCALSHSAHCFVYVDQAVSLHTLRKCLQDPVHGFRGYAIASTESVSEDALRPGGWTPHVSEDEVRDASRFRSSFVKPFGWFVTLDRRGDDDGHGPERLAMLFIGGDGFATYDALYCQGDGTPPPFLTVIQDHGFGGDFDHFGRCGLLERIARRRTVLSKLLLVANNSEPWRDYSDTGATAEPGGSAAHPRRLFRRVSPA